MDHVFTSMPKKGQKMFLVFRNICHFYANKRRLWPFLTKDKSQMLVDCISDFEIYIGPLLILFQPLWPVRALAVDLYFPLTQQPLCKRPQSPPEPVGPPCSERKGKEEEDTIPATHHVPWEREMEPCCIVGSEYQIRVSIDVSCCSPPGSHDTADNLLTINRTTHTHTHSLHFLTASMPHTHTHSSTMRLGDVRGFAESAAVHSFFILIARSRSRCWALLLGEVFYFLPHFWIA